jgi:ribosomal protein S18 acetylase RimI-like enzyme
MNIQVLTSLDSLEIASLHQRAFPKFFLTSLGLHFLSVFYDSVLSDPNGIGVGVFEDQRLVGFAIGTYKKANFYTSVLKKNSINLLFSCLTVLIKRPRNIIRLFNALVTKETEEAYISNNASLLSICTDPQFNNRGIGKEILKAFEEIAFLKASSISLTTDAFDNDSVNTFYRKSGYIFLKEFTQGKRKMNLYNKFRNA